MTKRGKGANRAPLATKSARRGPALASHVRRGLLRRLTMWMATRPLTLEASVIFGVVGYGRPLCPKKLPVTCEPLSALIDGANNDPDGFVVFRAVKERP